MEGGPGCQRLTERRVALRAAEACHVMLTRAPSDRALERQYGTPESLPGSDALLPVKMERIEARHDMV